MDRELLGAEVRRLRLHAGLTLDGLASSAGVSVRAIGDLERGVRIPRAATLEALADGLGLEGPLRDSLLDAHPSGTRTRALTLAPAPSLFVGRTAELQLLASELEAPSNVGVPRAVVISGASGMGKTALALEAARRSGDAQFAYVDATGYDASRSSLHALLSSLLRQVAEVVPRGFAQVVNAWADAQPRLTVLDNVANDALARSLLTAQVGGVAFITSRRPLQGLEGVRRIRVGPLSAADGVSLLEHDLGRADTAAVHGLAELSDGVPGALTIASALVRRPRWDATSVWEVLKRPAGRLRALATAERSMVVALHNTYSLLTTDAAAMLRAVADIDLPKVSASSVAELVGGDVIDVEDRLDELVDYGLLEADRQGYRMLPIVRLFARGIL